MTRLRNLVMVAAVVLAIGAPLAPRVSADDMVSPFAHVERVEFDGGYWVVGTVETSTSIGHAVGFLHKHYGDGIRANAVWLRDNGTWVGAWMGDTSCSAEWTRNDALAPITYWIGSDLALTSIVRATSDSQPELWISFTYCDPQ